MASTSNDSTRNNSLINREMVRPDIGRTRRAKDVFTTPNKGDKMAPRSADGVVLSELSTLNTTSPNTTLNKVAAPAALRGDARHPKSLTPRP